MKKWVCFVPIANVVYWYIFTMKNARRMAKGLQVKVGLCFVASGTAGAILLLVARDAFAGYIQQKILLDFVLYYLFSLILVLPQMIILRRLIKKD